MIILAPSLLGADFKHLEGKGERTSVTLRLWSRREPCISIWM